MLAPQAVDEKIKVGRDLVLLVEAHGQALVELVRAPRIECEIPKVADDTPTEALDVRLEVFQPVNFLRAAQVHAKLLHVIAEILQELCPADVD